MRTLLLCCSLAVLLVNPASAQLKAWVADVPFPFFAGDEQLAAGEYRFDAKEGFGRFTRIEALDTGRAIMVISSPSRVGGDKEKTAVVTFRKYGEGRVFLAGVQDPMFTGVTLGKSRREREVITSVIRAGGKPATTVTIAAR